MFDHAAPRPYVGRRNVNGRDLIQKEKLGKFLGVHAIVLALRTEDQSQLTWVSDNDSACDRRQLLEQIAVARRRLETDRERLLDLSQLFEDFRLTPKPRS